MRFARFCRGTSIIWRSARSWWPILPPDGRNDVVTLGAYIGDSGCAAALAVDGRVVSAVSDTSGNHARGHSALPSACVEQILRLSGLNACNISSVVLAEEGPPAEHHERAAAF